MPRLKRKPEADIPHCKAYSMGRCHILAGQEPGIGWHLSISCRNGYPTWDEIRFARYQLIPDEVTVAMILPPRSEYINIHSNCFHLYEIEGDRVLTGV